MDSIYTIKSALSDATHRLESYCHEEAELNARELIMLATGIKSRTELALSMNLSMDEAQRLKLDELTARRIQGEPLQYILSFWEFMGLTFKTDARALIPRQDTEALCEEAIALISAHKYKTCLDMCSGSGCIGISLAKNCGIDVTLADISDKALELSRENAELNKVNVKAVKSDMFSNISSKYDIITCNPPYLDKNDMAALQRELEFEPANALYGGSDGLDFYRRIAQDYSKHLNTGGALVLEVGINQAQIVCDLLGGAKAVRDLCGIERVVIKR